MQKNFLRKLWWDGRMGHTTYLMFFLAFLNFILITYNYLIQGNEILKTFVSDLWVFGTIFLILYFPISIIIGRWHTNTQIHVEQDILRLEDPIFARMVRTLLDVKTGKATKEEIEEFRKFLNEIEKNDIKEF